MADTHLDNSVAETAEHITRVDEHARFACCVHLGDMINGNIPGRHSRVLLREQMELFRGCVGAGRFYPVMGNHDEFAGGCTEQFWLDGISFLREDPAVHGTEDVSYYSVDVPERKIRMVFVCSFFYEPRGEEQKKIFGIGKDQIVWLEREALTVGPEWTVMLFSHDTPFSVFDEACFLADNRKINGTEALETLMEARERHGFRVAGWFVGHYHGDVVKRLGGIPFVLIGSGTPYVPQLWDMPEGGCFYERKLGGVTEDLWDAAALDTEKRRLYLYRFGAGKDRVIAY